MGVIQLWQIISPVQQHRPLSSLSGLTLAVDLSIWVCETQTVKQMQGVVTKPYLRNLFFRISHLTQLGVKLVFVVEGTAPELKWEAMMKRQQLRHPGKTGGNSTSRIPGKHSRRNFNACLKECCQLLDTLGIPHVQSAGEAEAMCAVLNAAGLVDGCLTNDGDAFLYGARVVYRNFTMNTKDPHVESYSMSDIEGQLGIDRKGMVSLALILGCDYLPKGVPGIGMANAVKLLQSLKGQDVLERLKCWRNMSEEACQDQVERAVRKKALSLREFPNVKVIREFIVMKDRCPARIQRWKQPSIKHFQDFSLAKLEWPLEYSHEKILPFLTLWQMVEMSDNDMLQPYLKPQRIVKERVRQGVPCYEIEWESPEPETPYCYVTIETQEHFSSCFHDMVLQYQEEKLNKKPTNRGKSRKKLAATAETLVQDSTGTGQEVPQSVRAENKPHTTANDDMMKLSYDLSGLRLQTGGVDHHEKPVRSSSLVHCEPLNGPDEKTLCDKLQSMSVEQHTNTLSLGQRNAGQTLWDFLEKGSNLSSCELSKEAWDDSYIPLSERVKLRLKSKKEEKDSMRNALSGVLAKSVVSDERKAPSSDITEAARSAITVPETGRIDIRVEKRCVVNKVQNIKEIVVVSSDEFVEEGPPLCSGEDLIEHPVQPHSSSEKTEVCLMTNQVANNHFTETDCNKEFIPDNSPFVNRRLSLLKSSSAQVNKTPPLSARASSPRLSNVNPFSFLNNTPSSVLNASLQHIHISSTKIRSSSYKSSSPALPNVCSPATYMYANRLNKDEMSDKCQGHSSVTEASPVPHYADSPASFSNRSQHDTSLRSDTTSQMHFSIRNILSHSRHLCGTPLQEYGNFNLQTSFLNSILSLTNTSQQGLVSPSVFGSPYSIVPGNQSRTAGSPHHLNCSTTKSREQVSETGYQIHPTTNSFTPPLQYSEKNKKVEIKALEIPRMQFSCDLQENSFTPAVETEGCIQVQEKVDVSLPFSSVQDDHDLKKSCDNHVIETSKRNKVFETEGSENKKYQVKGIHPGGLVTMADRHGDKVCPVQTDSNGQGMERLRNFRVIPIKVKKLALKKKGKVAPIQKVSSCFEISDDENQENCIPPCTRVTTGPTGFKKGENLQLTGCKKGENLKQCNNLLDQATAIKRKTTKRNRLRLKKSILYCDLTSSSEDEEETIDVGQCMKRVSAVCLGQPSDKTVENSEIKSRTVLATVCSQEESVKPFIADEIQKPSAIPLTLTSVNIKDSPVSLVDRLKVRLRNSNTRSILANLADS